MAEQQEGRWVTLDNGTHLFIKKGQTLDDAIATLGNGKEKGIESLKEKGWEYKNKNGNMRYNKGNVSVFQNATGKFVASYEETKNGVKETNSKLFNTLDEALKFTDEHKDFDDDYDFDNWDNDKLTEENTIEKANPKNWDLESRDFVENIDWDLAEKNEKINGDKAKSETRKDKYGNPLVSDEAFNIGVEAVKKYLEYNKKYGYDLEKLQKSNIFVSGLESFINKAISENGYDPEMNLTYQDINEIIGVATGKEIDVTSDPYPAKINSWTGKEYNGYKPSTKKVINYATKIK